MGHQRQVGGYCDRPPYILHNEALRPGFYVMGFLPIYVIYIILPARSALHKKEKSGAKSKLGFKKNIECIFNSECSNITRCEKKQPVC